MRRVDKLGPPPGTENWPLLDPFRNRPFGPCSGFVLAVLSLVLAPAPLWAAGDAFPRGPGFYFSLPKMFLLLLAFLGWVRTCAWVDRDARDLDLETTLWNGTLLGCGGLGLMILWLLPWFWIGFPLFLALFAGSSLVYVNTRNQHVPDEEKVLTERHLKLLAGRFLKMKLRMSEKAEEAELPPLRFLGKSTSSSKEDVKRVARAQSSKGYRAAVEMVHEAIEARATDIHLEPTKEEMLVRFRIDGIMQAVEPFERAMGDGVVNIFKVLCEMDITEKRKPQDGSFSAEVGRRIVDFRVATAGSVAGEKLVMRILDKSKALIDLTRLGMRDRMREQIHGLVQQPHGLFVVCGPTGAGKSTTLYAGLNEIDRFQRNVITVENPVEYNIENVTQIEINPKAGKTFASELRSILRQDPDVILIGEIRDQETAEIACQAAQTGHMVFTTLHANDSVTAVVRLVDLGVQPYSIASALSGVLSQRLVRLLCPECKVRYKPNPELLRKANLPADKIKYFHRPPEAGERKKDAQGRDLECPKCGGTGYYGRTGIFELLLVNDSIRELIRENPNPNTIKQEAIKQGMKSLQEDGLRQVIEGRTSIQELLRVAK